MDTQAILKSLTDVERVIADIKSKLTFQQGIGLSYQQGLNQANPYMQGLGSASALGQAAASSQVAFPQGFVLRADHMAKVGEKTTDLMHVIAMANRNIYAQTPCPKCRKMACKANKDATGEDLNPLDANSVKCEACGHTFNPLIVD